MPYPWKKGVFSSPSDKERERERKRSHLQMLWGKALEAVWSLCKIHVVLRKAMTPWKNKQIKRRQNKWLWWNWPAMTCNLVQVEQWKMWKGLLAPPFSSTETASASAVLTLGKEGGEKKKRRKRTKKRKTVFCYWLIHGQPWIAVWAKVSRSQPFNL